MSDEWRRRPRFWNDERTKLHRELYEKGVPAEEIAAALGATVNAVWRKAARENLDRPSVKRNVVPLPKRRKNVPSWPTRRLSWDDEEVAYLEHHYERGTHVEAIARKLGCSKGAVVGKANRLGLEHPNPCNRGGRGFNPRAKRWLKPSVVAA